MLPMEVDTKPEEDVADDDKEEKAGKGERKWTGDTKANEEGETILGGPEEVQKDLLSEQDGRWERDGLKDREASSRRRLQEAPRPATKRKREEDGGRRRKVKYNIMEEDWETPKPVEVEDYAWMEEPWGLEDQQLFPIVENGSIPDQKMVEDINYKNTSPERVSLGFSAHDRVKCHDPPPLPIQQVSVPEKEDMTSMQETFLPAHLVNRGSSTVLPEQLVKMSVCKYKRRRVVFGPQEDGYEGSGCVKEVGGTQDWAIWV